MSRTGLDAAATARSLRRMAGDGSVEWVTEPIQASVLLDVADTLDENAELREELELVGTAAYAYGRKDLAGENAKLRELVRTMAYCMQYGRDCDGCPMNGAGGELDTGPLLACDGLHARMRELGIEVGR